LSGPAVNGRHTIKTLILIAAAALSLTAAATAQTTATVSYADLDVANPAGPSVLTHCINNASHVAMVRCRARVVAIAMNELATKTAPQYAAR
jgi:hypothetical protein